MSILDEQARRDAQRIAMGIVQQPPKNAAVVNNPLQTKFGNSVLLLGSRAPTEVLRVLDLKLEEIDPKEQYKAGAWVLSLDAFNPDASTQFPGTTAVTATITIGSGGCSLPVQVTVIQGTTLQLPVASIAVDVNMVSSASVDMRVRAVVQRGFTPNNATLIQPVTLTSVTPQRGIIPPFARGGRLVAPPLSVWYSNELNISWGDGFNVWQGRNLREYAVRGQYFPVVPGRIWTVNSKPTATQITYGAGQGFLAEFEWMIAL